MAIRDGGVCVVANRVVGEGGCGLVIGLSLGGTRDEEGGGRKEEASDFGDFGVGFFWGRKGCGWSKGGAALGDAGLD